MDNQNPIVAALKALDVTDDAHWTSDGAPRLDVLRGITGVADLKREDVIALAPMFTRATPVTGVPDQVTEEGARDGADPEDEVEKTRQALSAKSKEIEAQKAEINEGTRALQKLQDEADALIRALEPAGPSHQDNQRSIMAFLDGQAKERSRKHAERQAALRGIDPATLNARSPLDNAFARKNKRGTTRPPMRVPQAS